MPDVLRPRLEEVRQRLLRRPASPGVQVAVDDTPSGWKPVAPFAEEEDWQELLLDAFGTRSRSVGRVFLHQFGGLCAHFRDQDDRVLRPNEVQLNAIVALITAERPRNEAEACFCAMKA